MQALHNLGKLTHFQKGFGEDIARAVLLEIQFGKMLIGQNLQQAAETCRLSDSRTMLAGLA